MSNKLWRDNDNNDKERAEYKIEKYLDDDKKNRNMQRTMPTNARQTLSYSIDINQKIKNKDKHNPLKSE